MSWSRLVLAVVSIVWVGPASVVAAECAWVLWSGATTTKMGIVGTGWDVLEGFETKTDCMQARIKAWKSDFLSWKELPSVRDVKPDEGRVMLDIFFTEERPERGNRLTVKYLCLPDPIDPREKKG